MKEPEWTRCEIGLLFDPSSPCTAASAGRFPVAQAFKLYMWSNKAGQQ